MSVTLASMLLRAELLRADQVDDLLQLQVVAGGALDTHVLEQGLLTEAVLLETLSAAYQLPWAGKNEIDQIDVRLAEYFPRTFADTYRLVPYSLIEGGLGVLVTEPPDETLLARLAKRLNLAISCGVTTEVRFYYAMQRLYRVELPVGIAGLLAKLDGTAVPAAADAPVFQRESTIVLPVPRENIDLETALRRMTLCRDRDQLIDVVLSFATQIFQFAGLFVVQNDALLGFRGKGDDQASARLPRVAIPLNQRSMFTTVIETQGHYLGQVPKAGRNDEVLDDLQRGTPRTVFLAPFVIAGKISGLLYADNGKRGVASRRVADLLLLMTRLGPHFERLIQRRKAEVKVALGELADITMETTHGAIVSFAVPPDPALVAEAPARKPTAEAPARKPSAETPKPAAPRKPASAASRATTEAFLSAASPAEKLSARMRNVWNAAQEEEPEAPEQKDEEGIDLGALDPDAVGQNYKAFADIDDSPEEAAAGWQDVLVETIASGKQGGDVPQKPQPRADAGDGEAPQSEMGWEDVLVETLSAATTPAPPPGVSAIAKIDDLAVLLDGLDSSDPEVARRAAESIWQRREELGEPLLKALGERFPGRLGIDPFAPAGALPPVTEMSQMLRLLCAMSPSSVAVVLPHLDSQYPVHRLLATLYFGQVVSGSAFSKLLRRLFDDEPRVREAAADVLRRYQRLAGYEEGIQKIRERLSLPVLDAQARATEILGRLRDAKSIPLLIPLTGHKRAEIANAALGALMRLTAQDFGHHPKKWTEWWVKNSYKPRETWLIEGLRRKEPLLRVLADEELRLLSGLTFQFDPGAERAAQEAAIKGWESWWASEERYRQRSKRDSSGGAA